MNEIQSVFLVITIGLILWIILDKIERKLKNKGEKDES